MIPKSRTVEFIELEKPSTKSSGLKDVDTDYL